RWAPLGEDSDRPGRRSCLRRSRGRSGGRRSRSSVLRPRSARPVWVGALRGRRRSCGSEGGETKEVLCVAPTDVVAPLGGQLAERLFGLVEVPVWEVAGVHERVPGAQELDRSQELFGVVGRLEWLGCEANVLPDV